METRANYAVIGLFTLATIAAAFGFVYWIAGRDTGAGRQAVRVVFSGSVSGLLRGSSVLFNGLRVGEVTDLRLLPEDPRRVVAVIEVDSTTPLKVDTRARLEYQGLTGVAAIQLSGGDIGAGPLVPTPGQSQPTIFAERSDFQDLLETARSLARRADEVLAGVERVVNENGESINRTVRNVERFSQALNDNAPAIDRFLAQVGAAAERIGPLSARLETLSVDLSELIRSLDRKRLGNIVANVEGITQSLASNQENVNTIFRDVASLAKRLNDSAVKLDATLTDVSQVARAFDPAKVSRAIDNADRFAQALGRTTPDAEKAVAQAAELTEKLNRSADRIDGVLKAAESFLSANEGEGKGAFQEVAEAARSIRALADNLDRRTAEITSGINRFTGPGLREYEALASEGRRTLNDINRTLRSFERNPQQLIFGGKPNLPEYQGRR